MELKRIFSSKTYRYSALSLRTRAELALCVNIPPHDTSKMREGECNSHNRRDKYFLVKTSYFSENLYGQKVLFYVAKLINIAIIYIENCTRTK